MGLQGLEWGVTHELGCIGLEGPQSGGQKCGDEKPLGRAQQETPLEYAERLVGEVPALEQEARGLAGLYARAAYARGRLPAGCLALDQGELPEPRRIARGE